MSGPAHLASCRLIQLPRSAEASGTLVVVEGGRTIPFEIKRLYYIHGVPEGAERGGHAHRALHQLFIAMAGSVDICLDDGREQATFHLDRPDVGLVVGPMIWRTLSRFTAGTVCAVLASEAYDEADYIRDHAEFVRARDGR